MASQTQAASAAVKVLAVTELREAIITHLPGRAILVFQRVSRTWQATILGHSMLQRAFGFEPRRLSSATGSHRRDNENGNELLDLHTEWSAIQFVEASERSPTCIINPLLGCLFEKMPKSDKLFYFATPDRLQQLATDEKAPWRGLLLSQPPAQGFTISWQCACVVEDDGEKWMDHQYGFLWNTHGVTIADLVRELARVERVDKVKEEGRPRCGREVWGLCWRC